jgi:hypothetical protein
MVQADPQPILDPRKGDLQTDASSTKSRSMLSLAGSLFVEISLPKLIFAWALLLVLPGLLLGLAPIIASDWVRLLSSQLAALVAGIWSLLILAVLLAIGWYGWRALFRVAESRFWTLNSIVVQPAYAAVRELLRHIAEKRFGVELSAKRRSKLRAAATFVAGLIVAAFSLFVLWIVQPHAQFFGSIAEIGSWRELVTVALANSVVVLMAYLALAAMTWGIADALMPQPRNRPSFDSKPENARAFRVVHLSDVHVVGEPYGFRLESGRAGPRGNVRFERVLRQLEKLDRDAPLDIILITGDMTDAGTSAEWSEFLTIMGKHPRLADRVFVIPGNHDLNIVDRSNPARFDLPTSADRRLRLLRALSAMSLLQGERVRVVDLAKKRLAKTLADAVRPRAREIARFADSGRPRFSYAIEELWAKMYPMVLPPDGPNGLGIILLNSNADTHFSFTNALGMVSAEQARGLEIAIDQYPKACWLVVLHHHVVEYPWPAKALSERIGTALINGNWFLRKLQKFASRIIVLHGHRHVDWIGQCGALTIISAPSPVMEATNDMTTGFYLHTLAVTDCGDLLMLQPRFIEVPGEGADPPFAEAHQELPAPSRRSTKIAQKSGRQRQSEV